MRKQLPLFITALCLIAGFGGAKAQNNSNPASPQTSLGPVITSWMLNTTGVTGYNNQPANVQQVQYTDSLVFVTCSDIPSYTIGPWPNNPNTATDQNFTYKITRYPQQNTGTLVNAPLGHEGVWKNGVSFFNSEDANSYNNQNIWHSIAVIVEASSFDACLAHPDGQGEYHNHQNPVCLYNDQDSTQHSPLLGYALDGFPVYGPYAYKNADGTGGITRMKSSYQLRNITQRHTLPDGTTLPSNEYGPDVSTTYPLGYYVEDYKYIAGSGTLDEHNGRFCVTPDYPNGTYAYFVTIDSTGASAYPYIIGTTYYGKVIQGNIGPGGGHNTVPSNATNYAGTASVPNYSADQQDVHVMPNPFNMDCQVKVNGNIQHAVIHVYNTLGQLEYSKSYTSLNNTNILLHLQTLPNGVYFLKITGDGYETVKRLIKEKE